ncbi:imidazolonepropionase-like domain-containing protein [Streptomyces mexicanus]|jgi:predicted amidohydrolase YtcJ|uniref:imidazolonepropionase-like domain-containing protein n=1 Tax=Streptomyces mexicanus TaxID=178566 RepID=UPI0031F1A6F6
MLTIHLADEVRRAWDAAPLAEGAVAVEGTRIAAVGTPAELRERFPGARERRWPGVLGPARVHEGPLPEAPSPRERVHAVLKLGAAAVLAACVDTPELRAAALRNDVAVLPAARPAALVPGGRADLAVFDADGACLATVCAGRLVHRRR